MKIGIVSDVHSNMDALKAALDYLDEQQVEQIVCLGDVVGYGPSPNECCEMLRELNAVTLLGNYNLSFMVIIIAFLALVVIIFSMQQHYNIGILLNTAGFA